MTHIYALINPENNLPFYVGKTQHKLNVRLYGHMNHSKIKNTKLYIFIRELTSKGLKPTIELIEESKSISGINEEKYYIERYRKIFNLYNSEHSRGLKYKYKIIDNKNKPLKGLKEFLTQEMYFRTETKYRNLYEQIN